MDMLPGIFHLLVCYHSQRQCRSFRLVVAANKVLAGIAAPERQLMQILAMRIDLFPVRQPRIDILIAGATPDHNRPLCSAALSTPFSNDLEHLIFPSCSLVRLLTLHTRAVSA